MAGKTREAGGRQGIQGEIEEEEQLPGRRGTGAARGSLKGILRTPICLRSAPIPAHHIHHVRPRRTQHDHRDPTSCQATSHITARPDDRCPLEGLLYSAPSTRAPLSLYSPPIMPFRAL